MQELPHEILSSEAPDSLPLSPSIRIVIGVTALLTLSVGTGIMWAASDIEGSFPQRVIPGESLLPADDQCPVVPEDVAAGLNKALTVDSATLRRKVMGPYRKGQPIENHAGEIRFREALARRFGVTLVSQNAINHAFDQVNQAQDIPATMAALNEFTTTELNIPTTYAKENEMVVPLDPADTTPAVLAGVRQSALGIVKGAELIPKELIPPARVESFQIAAHLESDDPGLKTVAFTRWGRTAPITLSADNELFVPTVKSSLVHEFAHRWQRAFCGVHYEQDREFAKLNPEEFVYDGGTDPYSPLEKSVTTSEYGAQEQSEDEAEILGWGIPSYFNGTHNKPIVGEKTWLQLARLNKISQGSPGSFLAAQSKAYNSFRNIKQPA